MKACKTQMKIDDAPPYTDVLFKLSELREVVSASRGKKDGKGSSASRQMLKSILDGIYDRMETHAMSKGTGIARMIYTEISGHAGLRVFQRLDALCLQYRRSDSRAAPAPASAPRRVRGRAPAVGALVRGLPPELASCRLSDVITVHRRAT